MAATPSRLCVVLDAEHSVFTFNKPEPTAINARDYTADQWLAVFATEPELDLSGLNEIIVVERIAASGEAIEAFKRLARTVRSVFFHVRGGYGDERLVAVINADGEVQGHA